VDLDAGRVVGELVLKDDPNWTISGIALLPGEASDEPETSVSEPAVAAPAESDVFDPYPELVRLAYLRFGNRSYAEALDLFRVGVQLADRYEQEVVDGLRFHVALCRFFLGDFPRALAALERLESEAVGGAVPRAALKYYQGVCYERLGDLERALAAFRQAPTEGLDDSLRGEIEQSRRRVEALTAR
jgi:tetratricopeptide (TPR) repeat protein